MSVSAQWWEGGEEGIAGDENSKSRQKYKHREYTNHHITWACDVTCDATTDVLSVLMLFVRKQQFDSSPLRYVHLLLLHSFFIENTFFGGEWNVLYFSKVTKNVWSTCYIMLFSTMIEIEIHVKKRGQQSQKVFFMKFAGQSEMFSLKNRGAQSLFLKNMFSIKNECTYDSQLIYVI